MTAPASPAVRTWLWVGIFFVLVQVTLGGVTRLTDSGLSMTNWEPVRGALPPLTAEAWREAFEDYKRYPEFYRKNADFSLAEFRRIFWWEYLHRAWARLMGLVFIIPFVVFWRRGLLDRKLRWHLGGVALLGAVQAVLGWYMVRSGLIDEPWVNPYRLTAHFFLALAIFAWLYHLILQTGPDRPVTGYAPRGKPWLWVITVLALVQMAYGGLVAGSDAARYFNTWPTMSGQLLPENLFADGLETSIFRENRITAAFVTNVQFIHRTLGLLVLASAGLFWLALRNHRDPAVRRGALLLLAAVGLQVLLGVLTLVRSSPTAIRLDFAVLHQLGAFLLAGVLVYLHDNRRAPATRGVVAEDGRPGRRVPT